MVTPGWVSLWGCMRLVWLGRGENTLGNSSQQAALSGTPRGGLHKGSGWIGPYILSFLLVLTPPSCEPLSLEQEPPLSYCSISFRWYIWSTPPVSICLTSYFKFPMVRWIKVLNFALRSRTYWINFFLEEGCFSQFPLIMSRMPQCFHPYNNSDGKNPWRLAEPLALWIIGAHATYCISIPRIVVSELTNHVFKHLIKSF